MCVPIALTRGAFIVTARQGDTGRIGKFDSEADLSLAWAESIGLLYDKTTKRNVIFG